MNNKQWATVNKGIARLESFDKVTGRGLYTDDFNFTNMAYGAILRSPHAHAKVINIDITKAMALNGVLAVLLPHEVEHIIYNSSGNPPSDLLYDDEKILTNHPLFEGDRILAIAAETPEICQNALALIDVTYEILPAVFDINSAIEPNSELVHPELIDVNICKTLSLDKGDIENALAQSYIVVEDTFTMPAINSQPMELTGCICHYNALGEILIYSTSQTIFQERRILAKMFEISESKVRIIKPLMGGGFGARQQLHSQPVGIFLSKKTMRPIKIIFTREEETMVSAVRHGGKINIKIGADKSGRLLAVDIESFHDTGAYLTHGPIVMAAQGKKTPYRVENYRYRGHCVYTNNVTAGAMRGYGNPQLSLAREVLMDRLAKELNMDSMEIRKINLVQKGDTVAGTTTLITSCELLACIDAGEKIKDKLMRKYSACNKKDAWGTAIVMHTSGPSNKQGMSSASICVNDDGSIQLLIGSADIGQGSDTTLAQIAAETLGIDINNVKVVAADTMLTPYDTGTFASSQIFVAGNAVLNAAEDVLNNISMALSKINELPIEKISWVNHKCIVGNNNTISFEQAVKNAIFGNPGHVILGQSSYKAIEAPPVFAVCWVRMTIDPLTEVLEITDIIETVDIGTAINPSIVKGQIEGGVLQGLAYGWMEQMEKDKRSNKVITSDLLLYKIPTSLDSPNIHSSIVESYDQYGPLGAKSVGELTLVPVAAAMANCVQILTGEKINSIPLSKQYLIKNSNIQLGADL